MPVIAIGLPSSSSHRSLDQPFGHEGFPSPIPEANEASPTIDAGVAVDMGGDVDMSDQDSRRGSVAVGDNDGGQSATLPSSDAPATKQHMNNHSIDSGVAFSRSPVTIKTVPLPTAPLPIVDDDCDTPIPNPHTSSSTHTWGTNALAGPSSCCAPDPPSAQPSNIHSAVPPPAQPRRHRSGVLMSQARSRSRAHTGGAPGGGFTSSKSFGDLNLMGLHMSSMTQGSAGESGGSGVDDGSTEESEGWDDANGRRVSSEGSRRVDVDDGQMWDNRFVHDHDCLSRFFGSPLCPGRCRHEGQCTLILEGTQITPSSVNGGQLTSSARFYHHLQSRPQSRQTSPDRSHTQERSHRSGDASPTGSSPQTSPIYVRRAATLPHAHNGAGPPPPSANHMSVNAHGHHAMHPSAALSPHQAFLSSHLPPIFNPSPGSSPEYGGHGPGAHGLGVPPSHNMVILTPTTAEWKELKKEMSDLDRVESSDGSGPSGSEDSEGSGSGASDGNLSGHSSPGSLDGEDDAAGRISDAGNVPEHGNINADRGGKDNSAQTQGLMLDQNGSPMPDLHIPPYARPTIRPTLSADFLPREASHTPDPGVSSPPDDARSPSNEDGAFGRDRPSRASLSAGPPVFMQKIIAPSPILPDTPSMADVASVSPVIVNPDDADGSRGGSDGQGVQVAGEDDTILDEPTTIERFSSIGRRDSLRAVSKVRLPRTKTRRELERERLFKDLDEELEKDQDSPKAFEPVIAIGNGLGLVRDTSSGASSAPVPIGGDSLSRDSSLRSEGRAPAQTVEDQHAQVAQATGAASAGASEGYFTTGARIEGSLGVNTAQKGAAMPGGTSRSQTDPTPASVIRTSPTQPIKPSPLHASPITALSTISSPTDTPAIPIPMSPPATARTLSGSRKRTTSRPFSRSHSRQTSVAAQEANLETIRSFARSIEHPHSPRIEISNPLASPPSMSVESGGSSPKGVSPPERRRRDTKRVSLVAGRVVQPFMIPPSTALPPDRSPGSQSPGTKKASLNSFSPFRTPAVTPSTSLVGNMHNLSSNPGSLTALSALGGLSGASASVLGVKPGFQRFDSTISVAASTAPPSEPGTPGSETAGGLGGRGIEDYCILSEAGKGAYGLVMRAKVKGRNGEPVGEEVIIKYIVKARILADCWKK